MPPSSNSIVTRLAPVFNTDEDWTFDKQKSIDWSDAQDVVAHRFLFINLRDMHKKFDDYCSRLEAQNNEGGDDLIEREKRRYQAEPLPTIQGYITKGLFASNDSNSNKTFWCAGCRYSGHTLSKCPTRASNPQQQTVSVARTAGTRKKQAGAKGEDVALAAAAPSSEASDLRNSRSDQGVFYRFRQHCRACNIEQKAEQNNINNNDGGSNNSNRFGQSSIKKPFQSMWVPFNNGNDGKAMNTVGRLRAVDLNTGVGEIEALGSVVSFFCSRARFGLKKPREGEIVLFKAERAGERIRGVDVILDRTNFVQEDVEYLIGECNFAAKDPIATLRHLLSNADEWVQLLRAVCESSGTNEVLAERFACAIVNVVSFRRNLFPIHAPVMKLIARLLCMPFSGNISNISNISNNNQNQNQQQQQQQQVLPVSFVPNLVNFAIPSAETTSAILQVASATQVAHFVGKLHQIASFFFTLKLSNFAAPPECADKLLAAVDCAVHYFRNTNRFDNTAGMIRRLDEVIRNLMKESSTVSDAQLPPLPTASELLHFHRAFNYKNLPVLTHSRTAFSTQQELVSAHLKLLRADVCEATSRMISSAFFNVPGSMMDDRTLLDLSSMMTYSNVTFVGRTCSRHFESCTAALLHFQPDKEEAFAEGQARGRYLTRGRLLLLNTSENPDRVTDKDLFWLVVQSSDDSPLLGQNIVAVSPVVFACSTTETGIPSASSSSPSPFSSTPTISPTEEAIEKLRLSLERNEKKGQALLFNRMIETELFLQGYEPVFRALSSYLIPTCPVNLPMPEEFFGKSASASLGSNGKNDSNKDKKTKKETTKTKEREQQQQEADHDHSSAPTKYVAPNVVPPHFAAGFNHIVQDIRTRNTLDAGQDLAMRSLATRRLILVQGPPGTGKSFIGCRVVEAYVRYKHGLRSGAMLQHVDPLLLPSTADADLNPSMGPIVVITYKNHALDEFLLDLKRSGLWGSSATGTADSFSRNSVVRVGSGSSEPELQEINIARLVDASPTPDITASFTRMVEILKKIEHISSTIKDYESGFKNPTPQQFAGWLTTEQRDRFFTSLIGNKQQINSSVFASTPGLNSTAAASAVILASNPSIVAGAEEDIRSFLKGEKYVGGMTTTQISRTFHDILRPNVNVSRFKYVSAAASASASSSSFSPSFGQHNEILTTEAQEVEEESCVNNNTTSKSNFKAVAGSRITDNSNNNNKNSNNNNNDEADQQEDEEAGLLGSAKQQQDSDQIRQSTFAAVRQELLTEGRRFGHPEAGLTATISKEALSLAAVSNPRQAFVKESWGQLQSVWSLAPQERHEFVAAHARREIAALASQYVSLSKSLEIAVTLHQHLKNRLRMDLLRTADVVGITTTGCAINQDMLRSIEPQVIIVEEAAEVLESQLLACLPESLKQVVLIGDHYQLQPSVDTYEYELHNGLNISLFERLVKGTKPILLTEQRRMRPEIADMVRPFYRLDAQVLEDHESVRTRKFCDRLGRTYSSHVPGLVHNVFFWTHSSPERQSFVGRSIINLREVEIITMLVQHLLSQKLHPTSITVITPYLGQRTAIKAALKQAKTEVGVRVSTVDRFQGDEADVIILSLVRTSKLTDFLKYRNRLIVAASRARFAMVFVGNDTLLEGSPHWNALLNMLKEKHVVSDKLPVRFASSPSTAASGAGTTNDTTNDEKIVLVSSEVREWPVG